jgi:transcriptional regulator with XRE-family HTH domain
MHTGDRIRELRHLRGMTQQELADALGCSRPAVVLWETRARQTPLYQLRKIGKILQSPLSELLGEWRPGEAQMITDASERALVEMYRQLPKALRQKHLELFAASVEIREEGKSKRNVPHVIKRRHADDSELASESIHGGIA